MGIEPMLSSFDFYSMQVRRGKELLGMGEQLLIEANHLAKIALDYVFIVAKQNRIGQRISFPH